LFTYLLFISICNNTIFFKHKSIQFKNQISSPPGRRGNPIFIGRGGEALCYFLIPKIFLQMPNKISQYLSQPNPLPSSQEGETRYLSGGGGKALCHFFNPKSFTNENKISQYHSQSIPLPSSQEGNPDIYREGW